MSKTFTIQISSFKPPFMREKMTSHDTVVKKRVGYQYKYVEHRWNNPKCGRPQMYKDTEATIAERAPYNERFAQQVQRAYDRAVIRFHKHYAGINREDEVIRSYAPYKQAPNAILHEMSQRWVQYGKDKKFLEGIVSRLKIKYNAMMMVAQQGKYKLISDALYDVHKAYHELQSLCRPDHHVVVYKGKKDPLLANRK
tara:strand:- start:948 stop:1538 length:591 start_codon:yes stop_codon:yes gene_type:complete